MPTLPITPFGIASATPAASENLSAIRERLSSATLSLHQTLGEMMGVLESQIAELHSLRTQLNRSESQLRNTSPVISAVLPELPPLTPASRPLTPMPPPLVTPTPTTFPSMAAATQVTHTRPLPPAPSPVPVSTRLASGPMMTQILWPSKQPAVGPAPEAPVSAPMPPACPEPAPPAPAAVAQPVVPLRNDYTPNLEQATMEELNAALAYAFSQVSSGPAPAQAKRDSVTHLMPGPLPTSALRYGQAPAFAGA